MTSSMRPRPRGYRLLVGFSIGIFALTLIHAGRLMSAPFDGVAINFAAVRSQWTEDGVVAKAIETRADGVRADDVVIAVNGRSVASLARGLFEPASWPAETRAAAATVYTVRRDDRIEDIRMPLAGFPFGAYAAQQWVNLLAVFPLLGLAVSVLRRAWGRESEGPATLFFAISCFFAAGVIIQSLPLRVSLLQQPAEYWAERVISMSTPILLMGALLHFGLTFPKPRPWLVARPGRGVFLYVGPVAILVMACGATSALIEPGLPLVAAWARIADAMGIFCFGGLAVLIALNARGVGDDPVARGQARWVVLGYSVTLTLMTLLAGVARYALGQPILSNASFGLLSLPFVVCVAVAILRYRLFDIDRIISSALAHGILTALVVGVFVIALVALPALLAWRGEVPLSVAAAALVAVLFTPVRDRVQKAVDRMVYGERGDPYGVLSGLGRRLEAGMLPDEMAVTIAETVIRALKLPYAAIALALDDDPAGGLAPAAAAGTPVDYPLIELPLAYQGAVIGALRVAPRARGETLDPADRQLLQDLALQAGIALSVTRQTRRALRLAADLSRARERLVTAREEERRRLRRDLHDGLGPQLASQTLSLNAAVKLIRADPARAEELLRSLDAQSRQAVDEIRDLVYALRPPMLDDLGLRGAIQQLIERLMRLHPPLVVSLQAVGDLPRLSAAVEVAVYRITQEALTNVVRHAGASACSVVIRTASDDRFARGALLVEISDDGHGFPAHWAQGVGMQSMRERAEELGGHLTVEPRPGGGSRVAAALPLRLEEIEP